MNGYLHQVWRGDALAGAGVGCVKVVMDNTSVMLCVTHMHAAYPGDNVSQIYIQGVPKKSVNKEISITFEQMATQRCVRSQIGSIFGC